MPGLAEARWVAECLVAGAPLAIPQSTLIELGRRLQSVSLPPGAVLYRAAEPVTGVWIVTSGRIAITTNSGRGAHTVSIERSGDVVGDLYVLLGKKPPLTARSTEDVHCFFLDADDFRWLIESCPPLAAAWACSLAHRLSRTRDRIIDSTQGSLAQQLARLLLSQGENNEVRMSQSVLAHMLGAQRTSVNKILKEFETAGLVELGYMRATICDPEGLATVAGSGPRVAREVVRPSSSREGRCEGAVTSASESPVSDAAKQEPAAEVAEVDDDE